MGNVEATDEGRDQVDDGNGDTSAIAASSDSGKRSSFWSPRTGRKGSRTDIERRASALAKKGVKSPTAKWQIAGGKAMYAKRQQESRAAKQKEEALKSRYLAELDRKEALRLLRGSRPD